MGLKGSRLGSGSDIYQVWGWAEAWLKLIFCQAKLETVQPQPNSANKSDGSQDTVLQIRLYCCLLVFFSYNFWPIYTNLYNNKKYIKNINVNIRVKLEKCLPFFHSGGHTTNFNALFWMLTLGHICCLFAYVLVSISLIQGWRVKGTLSIKIIVLWPPELEFCGLRKTKQTS